MTEHDHADEDFAAAWEHEAEHDVGADTSEFEAFRADDDTAELLRRRVRGDVPEGGPPPDADEEGEGASRGPSTALIVTVLAVVFVVIAVLYVLD